MNIRKTALDLAVQKLKELVPDARRILFGSEARGDSRPDSDIDILVILPDDSVIDTPFNKLRSEIWGAMYDVELHTGIVISTHVVIDSIWHSHRTPLMMNINNEGIEI